MAPIINAELVPNKCHSTNGTNASKGGNDQGLVENDEQTDAEFEASLDRVVGANSSTADLMRKARAERKAADVGKKLAAEEAKLSAMKNGKKNGEG